MRPCDLHPGEGLLRRLAKQSRKDAVRSQRDYQEITHGVTLKVRLVAGTDANLRFAAPRDLADGEAVGFVGAGAYVKTLRPATIEMVVGVGPRHASTTLHSDAQWRRLGYAIPATPGRISVDLRVSAGARELHVWGLDAGLVREPEGLRLDPALLNSVHLSPETYYLDHGAALALEREPGWSGANAVVVGGGDPIGLKKCAYCQRLLPVDPDRPSALAFHKHNAKRTRHQNECRACKKWRINDDFNPKRTIDQLHESSVITRERRLFLRDPEVLQSIKDREGAGLKSIVWKRFQRRCFRCGRRLKLAEVELDHTRPMAYLWPIDEHATCLCSECNNFKKDRFPVDVYSRSQLRRLSRLTGLPYEDLMAKDVCQEELDRILADIVAFAREWDPAMFNATARKVRELRPGVDLFEELRRADPSTHATLMRELAARPAPVEVEDV